MLKKNNMQKQASTNFKKASEYTKEKLDKKREKFYKGVIGE